jgi:alginate O-acetyltransferase complex protein AlgI
MIDVRWISPMMFQSIEFLAFLAGVAAVYYLLPHKARRYWLLLASYGFYMLFSPVFALYLGSVTLFTFLMGKVIEKKRTASLAIRHALLASGIALTFAPLAILKYGNFFITNLNQIVHYFDASATAASTFSVVVPIGISFYSFMAVSYLIDVYRGKTDAEHSIITYALFIAFFPMLLSGPIERSTNLLRQLRQMPAFNSHKLRQGLLTMAWGYFLKLVIADRLGVLVGTAFEAPEQFGGCILILMIIGFGIQLYTDFMGISMIAVGIGEVLGFDLIQNFNTPYFSISIGDFWRRWHISLSYWFRDYLYIPLGGNRKGVLRKYLNIMIVFIVSGLWHGAGWTFLVWGALNGLYIVIGETLQPARKKLAEIFNINPNNLGNRFFRILFTFIIVNFAWLFFRATSITQAVSILNRIYLGLNPWELSNGTLLTLGLDLPDMIVLASALLILFAMSLIQYRGIVWQVKLLEQGYAFRTLIYIVIVMIILIFGMYGPSFNASSFIYVDF